MSSNTTAATLPAHRLKDATPNDSSSDLSDQEPAGLGDDQLSSLPPTAAPNMANRGRRTSVSAESMNPTYSSENGSPGSDPTEQGRMEKVVIPKTQQQKDRIRQSIQNNFLFRNLDEEQYREVVDAMAELKVAVGTEVIKQGAIGDYFYIVETGSLDVFVQRQGQAQPHKVTAYGPGGSFGELALMYNAPRAATVTATNECILWALDRVTFRRILMESTNRRRRMYEQFLEEVPLLKSLESYERHKIADALESVTFESGHVVMRQGDMGDQFYIVESGEAKVTQVDDKGVEQVVAVLKKGQYFGELALLSNKPRAATVTASGKLKCATLGKKAFDRLLGPALDIIKRNTTAYKALSRRKSIQELVEKLEKEAAKPVGEGQAAASR